MATLNIAGNFQPSSVQSGRNLPHTQSGAPSTSSSLKKSNLDTELKQVSKIEPALVESVRNTKDQRIEKANIEVENQIEALQQFNQSIDRTLQFKVDKELGVTIVRVIDKETDELIRQFPPEELLNLSRRLKDLNEQQVGNSGVLLQEKV